MTPAIHLALSVGTILASALGAFWGVRVSIARLEERVRAAEAYLARLEERMARLEEPHFQRQRR